MAIPEIIAADPGDFFRPTGAHPNDRVSQYRYVHPFQFAMILLELINVPLALLLFFFVSRELAVIPLVTFILAITASRRSTARRYEVDFSCYRTPRYPRLSAYLASRMNVFSGINIAVTVSVALVCLHVFQNRLAAVLMIAVLSSISAFPCYSAIKALIKYRLDSRFRIVVFRRFGAGSVTGHKVDILPICGLFGQVLLLTDPSLDEAWEGGKVRMERWVLSEIYQPMSADDPADWQAIVETELRYADLVVLDWTDRISESMLWELHRSLDFLPAHRLVVVIPGESRDRVIEAISGRRVRGDARQILALAAPRSAVEKFLFHRGFIRRICSLQTEPRFWPRDISDATR